jgi:hypothetical protein
LGTTFGTVRLILGEPDEGGGAVIVDVPTSTSYYCWSSSRGRLVLHFDDAGEVVEVQFYSRKPYKFYATFREPDGRIITLVRP